MLQSDFRGKRFEEKEERFYSPYLSLRSGPGGASFHDNKSFTTAIKLSLENILFVNVGNFDFGAYAEVQCAVETDTEVSFFGVLLRCKLTDLKFKFIALFSGNRIMLFLQLSNGFFQKPMGNRPLSMLQIVLIHFLEYAHM